MWNTDFGIGIGILKYLGIRYRYRLPTQDYYRPKPDQVDSVQHSATASKEPEEGSALYCLTVIVLAVGLF